MRIVKKQPLNNGVMFVMAEYGKKYPVTWGAADTVESALPTEHEFAKGSSDERCAPPSYNWPKFTYKQLTYNQAVKRFAQLVEALPTVTTDWHIDDLL